MKIILLEDVKSLGKKGDIVNVNDGYARNFILPKKLGVEATGKNLNDLKLQDRHAEKVAQEQLEAARALAKKPKLLLCDEPTGALDYVTGRQILKLLQDTCRREGITIVLITHNSALAPMADRLIRFRSGKVVEMTCNAHPVSVEEIEW